MKLYKHRAEPKEMNGGTKNVRQHIKRKNEARSKWLQNKTRASQEVYKKMRIKANVLIRQKKKVWTKNKILQIQYNQKKKRYKEVLSRNKNL